jgi:uncharacterized sporulation protein YeaH/YhbH (DUF444 family)
VVRKIDQDVGRFRQIVKGAIRKNLRKFISRGELIGRSGGRTVSIPLPQIQLPRFAYGSNRGRGVGQGGGDPGTPIDEGESGGEAGDTPGEHVLEAEVSLEELARILGEELELPRIEPRGRRQVTADVHRLKSIRRSGPESLRHFKRTYKQALKRQLMSGTYDPENPLVIPEREDRRYRSFSVTQKPQSNAAILYMMDVSGSMGDEQKDMVRITAFWIDTWIRAHYRNLDVRYIVHDATAKEVDQHAFFHLKESGGTKISSAFELADAIIRKDYPPSDWNLYPFHFSDGDNWSGGDTEYCIRLLEERLLPISNLFCYGQVKSAYGSGQFKPELDEHFAGDRSVEWLVTADIPDRDSIVDAIRTFLGKGR